MHITLTNTLSKKKENLSCLKAGEVKLYVCGITPYDYAHIGHGRVYVFFDVLVRLLTLMGNNVLYVRNFTDIDDKLINKAIATKNDPLAYKEVAQFFIDQFHDDMKKLGCLSPTYEPRVTECIPEIIAFVEKLVAQGNAYVVGSDVYFDITTFSAYGKLSKRNLTEMVAGARVEVNEVKRNPGDFALWKGNDEKQFWQSPWGYGRPGWHIECSVMAEKFLGPSIDIHGGGMDLIFPHHENEVAQSECLHKKPFASIWLHNAFVNINKEKMSKSLGNFITLNTLFASHDPMVVRYFYLQHHYRTPIDFSDQELEAAKTAYKKLMTHFGAVAPLQSFTSKDLQTLCETDTLVRQLIASLTDDLNTPKFLGIVFEHLAVIAQSHHHVSFVAYLLRTVLGLSLQPLEEKTQEITPEIQELLNRREQARKEKNWALADALRDELATLGYAVQDKKVIK